MNGDSDPGRGKKFIFSQDAATGCVAYRSHIEWHRHSFCGVRRPGSKVDHTLSYRLRMSELAADFTFIIIIIIIIVVVSCHRLSSWYFS
jgi:hypothetical protein